MSKIEREGSKKPGHIFVKGKKVYSGKRKNPRGKSHKGYSK